MARTRAKRDDLSSITDTNLGSAGQDEGGLALSTESSPLILYGRTSEINQLTQSFKRVVHSGISEIIMVHGPSGTGKTALVDVLRDRVCESKGYFCGGKFFQEQGGELAPYSTILAAFSDLCDLMSQPEFGVSEKRKAEIQKALGSDGHVLADTITNIAPFVQDMIDEEQSVSLASTVIDTARSARFKIALKTFLHVVSSGDTPIVFFMDDVQWMDDPSKEWILWLLHDRIIKNVLWIMAYGDEEGDKVEDLLVKAKNSPKPFLEIGLNSLDRIAVHQLVCASLGSSLMNTSIRELSDLISHKTNGNPFHVIECVTTIRNEGLLVFNKQTNKWDFDVDRIRREVMVSESLADVLLRKIQRLPRDVQETLKIASLVGFRFGESILVEVVASALTNKCTSNDESTVQTLHALNVVSNSLSRAVDDSLVEKTGKNTFQFSHDKLHLSFQTMLNDDEREQYHLLIGEQLIELGGDGAMYQAAQHLNKVMHVIHDEEQKVRLARINLEAAKFCKFKSAFADAASFLRTGMRFLDEDTKWTSHFALTYELTLSLAKMELATGNLESCEDMTTQALLHGRSVAMHAPALLIRVELRMIGRDLEELLSVADGALKILGVEVPENVGYRHVSFKVVKVKSMIGRKSDEAILALPKMNDRVTATAVKILLHKCMYCLSREEKHNAMYAALLATELTLKHGVSPYSANAIAVYGIAELSMGNVDRAYRFGMLALKLVKQIKRKETECPTIMVVMTLLAHWKVKLNQLVDPLHRGFMRGAQSGDTVHGAHCLANCFGIRCFLGTNLIELEEYMRTNYQRVCDLQRVTNMTVLWAQPAYQFVLNMLSNPSDWKELLALNGDAMKESTFFLHADRNQVGLRWVAWFYKLQLACHFGYYSVIPSLLEALETDGQSAKNHFNFYLWQFFGALSSFELYRRTSKRKHLTEARAYQKTLQKSSSAGNPNLPPFLNLLAAEELSIKKSGANVIGTSYNVAIASFAEAGLVHMEALANERAGFLFARKLMMRAVAVRYFERALDIHQNDWGSIAKYEWLQHVSSKCLANLDQQTISAETGFGTVVGDVIQLSRRPSAIA